MMFIRSQIISLLAISSFAAAAVTPFKGVGKDSSSTTSTCQNPTQRKAWYVDHDLCEPSDNYRHTLANPEKKAYIDAVLCLMAKPTTSGFDGSQSIWDDLTYVHRVNTNIIHNVGALLPWHRYCTYLHETLLRQECGYTGFQPYWETVRDVGHVINASILDPVTGFGCNGTSENLCVPDGPFSNVTLHLGPKYTNTDHCLSRNINELVPIQNCSQSNIDTLFTYSNFTAVYDLFGNSVQYV